MSYQHKCVRCDERKDSVMIGFPIGVCDECNDIYATEVNKRFMKVIIPILAAIFAFWMLIALTSCTKKDQGCYTCKIYGKAGLQDVTTICDESQVQPFKDAYKGTGLGVSCAK